MSSYYSNGKLLLTGEYVVLDGAKALAIPTKYGQSLTVTPISEKKIYWKSIDALKDVWLKTSFDLSELNGEQTSENDTRSTLLNILKVAKALNSEFSSGGSGFEVVSKLDFPRNWGLGSSSTLINNIANWAGINAFELLAQTFGGSGYDIACAQHNLPITYQLKNSTPDIKEIDFSPKFSDQLYFVHLNKKQNSREGIIEYNSKKHLIGHVIDEISAITEQMVSTDSIDNFNNLLEKHEEIISSILQQPTVKDLLFKDFNGSIKSLGAWGGDFVLVSSSNNPRFYFEDKGYNTIISYEDMIKK